MKRLLMTLAVAALCAAALPVYAEGERAPVGTRMSSTEGAAEPREQMEQPQKEEGDDQPSEPDEAELKKVEGDREEAAAYSYISAAAYGHAVHHLVGTGFYGDYVEFENWTRFVVRPADRYTVSYWPLGSDVYVTPNHGFFFGVFHSDYKYWLVNAGTQETVEVDLLQGPELFGALSEWITGINDYTGMLWLADGRVALVHPSDRAIMWNWQVNDHLVVGINDGFQSTSYPNILIDCPTLRYIRVKFVN